MRPKDTWHLQDSNAVNETSWDAHGVEIETCAIFDFLCALSTGLQI